MKRISTNLLTLNKKHKIAEYTEKVIQYNFSKDIESTQEVLHNSVNYLCDVFMGEPILKQTLLKGLFPRVSYKRSAIEKELRPNISEKLEVRNAQ